ncbi:GntR family transcriptional regulator [Paracoccus pacificus]|uniref:GntR family transcriptional regulator n=1 Tax=Paracoccus pacificus TaxID=1463598 RepID=A0ABW4R8K5_9RHOB
MKLSPDVAILVPSDSNTARRGHRTWRSVQLHVLSRIRSGEWKPGDLISTEHQLASELGCARATVNRALRELAETGVIERRRKVGTRVAEVPTYCAVLLPSIRREVEEAGHEFRFDLLEFSSTKLPAQPATAMHMVTGAPVIFVRSLFWADGEACSHETKWVNPAVAGGMTAEALESVTAYEWLSRNTTVTRANIELSASAATESEAVPMGLPTGAPMLTINRTLWSQEVAISHARQIFAPGYSITSSF